MGRARGMSSLSLSSWRQRRDGNIARKASLCLCLACGPRGRRVTAQTFDKHTSRMWTGVLQRDPEPLGALYEQYRARVWAGEVSTSDQDTDDESNQFDGYLSDLESSTLMPTPTANQALMSEPAAAPPAPLHMSVNLTMNFGPHSLPIASARSG